MLRKITLILVIWMFATTANATCYAQSAAASGSGSTVQEALTDCQANSPSHYVCRIVRCD
jgi:hypothetical protein